MMKSSSKLQPSASTNNDVGWRQFPEFEKLLTFEEPPLLARIEKTCRKLNDVLQSGSESDRQRAQMAMTAYGRSLDLLRLLVDMRDRAAQQQAEK